MAGWRYALRLFVRIYHCPSLMECLSFINGEITAEPQANFRAVKRRGKGNKFTTALKKKKKNQTQRILLVALKNSSAATGPFTFLWFVFVFVFTYKSTWKKIASSFIYSITANWYSLLLFSSSPLSFPPFPSYPLSPSPLLLSRPPVPLLMCCTNCLYLFILWVFD